jgi:hypothetical protein
MKPTKTLTLIAASKLAVGIGSAAHADDASLGSKAPADTAPKLGLFEIGYPLELLTPPTEGIINASATTGSKNTTADANAQQLAKKGRIWTKVIPKQDANGAFPQNTPHPRIDFVVSNIRNDGAVTVYLLYGTRIVSPQFQIRQNAGTFNLDLNSLGQDTHILAGVRLQPEEKMAGLPTSPVGKDLGPKTRSAVISIALNDLTKVTGNEVYFQAAVIPDNGGVAEAQASEVDHFVIERVNTTNSNSGSKASKTASSTIKNNDGSTTQQACGKQGVVAVCNNNSSTAPSQNTSGSKTTQTTTGSETGSKTSTSSTGSTTTSGTTSGSKQ